ncbi:MAG: tRNA (adenosine(37)-N6)-threonylcarbamoyltransferase complex transferase subunit TsaD [Mucinivorans sp.]
MEITILGIESSCDDTSAAIVRSGRLLSNVIASQAVHAEYGGVIPELASRAHGQNIVPVIDAAIKRAGIGASEIDAVAFTRGPGLMGSLLVGISFAKGFSLATDIPLIEINHLQGHILSHFVEIEGDNRTKPKFPFLCLLVSGGHTQIVLVRDFFDMEIVGTTIDDAAGEAFDKCAKVMGLPYPGGPVVDKLAKQGNPLAFKFARPVVGELDFSFSGLKTSFLYFLRDKMAENPHFIEENRADLAASLQHTIVNILISKLVKAAKKYNVQEVAVAGGVSANSGLREGLIAEGLKRDWVVHIPPFVLTTDNAAMIAITGYYKYLKNDFANLDVAPFMRGGSFE